MNTRLKALTCVMVAAVFCPTASFGDPKGQGKVQLAAKNWIAEDAPRYPVAVLESKGVIDAAGASDAKVPASGPAEEGGLFMPKPPPCPAWPVCLEFISALEASTADRHASNLGIIAVVKGEEAVLEEIAVEIYSGQKLVARTAGCDGCPVRLKTSKDGKADSKLFVLDPKAVQAFSKFYSPKNEITARGRINSQSGSSVTLSLVALKHLK
jgi:hypothetical protein